MATDCANPLLLEWVKELYDVAKDRNTKGVTTYVEFQFQVAVLLILCRYRRAYESMKACPLTFKHPSEAQQLGGIGPVSVIV